MKKNLTCAMGPIQYTRHRYRNILRPALQKVPCCTCQFAEAIHHILCSSLQRLTFSSVIFYFSTTEEYGQESALLSSRFAGTHKLHCIRLMWTDQVEVKKFSNSHESRAEHVIQSESVDIPQSVDTDWKCADLTGYVTPKYDGYWCVTFAEHNEVEINFMHPPVMGY